MPTKLIPIKSRETWLEERKKHITSTESASLFGLQMPSVPTAYELWHIKRGLIDGTVEANSRMVWGTRFEEAIAHGVGEDNGWSVFDMNNFAVDEDDRMGASYDYFFHHPERGLCLMEIKTVAYRDYKMKFIEDDERDENGDPVFIEAPTYYEVQVQHGLELINHVPGLEDKYEWCLLVVFVMDTRDVKLLWRQRDKNMGAALRKKVKEFWSMTEPPPPDLVEDSELLAKMHRANNTDSVYDATEDNEFEMAALAYIQEGEKAKAADEAKKRARSQMILKMGSNNAAFCNSARISNKSRWTVTEMKGN